MHVVFSDLDGTLLDHITYSYEESLEGILILRERKIPLVLVSSKTISEMKLIHQKLELNAPFVFENGGGIAYPFIKDTGETGYRLDMPGLDIDMLKDRLSILRKALGVPFRTMLEMNIDEVVDRTGLSRESAALSVQRSSTIPFVFLQEDASPVNINKVNSYLKEHELAVTRGGRFYHFLSAGVSKGIAVQKLVRFFKDRQDAQGVESIAIGDSENDITMLKEVDSPFLVKRHDGTALDLNFDVKKTEKIGPAGFTEAVKKYFL